MGPDSINASSTAKRPSPNPRSGLPCFLLHRRFSAVAIVILLLGGSELIRGADPYAVALDKRFATETAAPEVPDPAVAALENGIKEQAREMSQRPEASPPASDGASAIKVCLLWTVGAVGALCMAVVAVIGLRRWNRWLDTPAAGQGSAESIMAEDPALAEFLCSLREGGQAAPLPARLPIDTVPQDALASTVEGQSLPATDPTAEALALMREPLACLRAAFPEFGRAPDEAQRLSVVREVTHHVELIKDASGAAPLRSIWLLASALQGLLKQLGSNASNITPSTLRTIATAIDSLELLSSRTVRPDLCTNPPVRLLAVDDDPISRRVISAALKKAFSETDLASDGQSALVFASQQAYDLIFLDVEMPGLDGFEVCSKIHESELNRATPVVFVTSHTDFESRAKSAHLGAHDLIGKPFLAFEITVKALTFVLRARLEDRGVNHDSSELKKASSAEQSVDVPAANPVAAAQTSNDVPADNARQVTADAGLAARPSAGIDNVHSSTQEPDSRPQAGPQPSSTEFALAFFKGAPSHLQILLGKLASIRALTPGADRDEFLGELFIEVHAICSEAGRAQLDAAFRVSSALEAMLKRLLERPAACTSSTLHTATAALETILQLCQQEEDLDLTQTPARLLVVDDDPIARRAIGGALQLAFGRPDSADCGEAALVLANEKTYDLILLDVMMPGMDGFATCTRLHEAELNRLTPVVFVTSQDDSNTRDQAAASGGRGFIPKPVLPCELMLLALTYIVRGRLERRAGETWESPGGMPACESVLAG
jgi:CheY-like chemotaxis protein